MKSDADHREELCGLLCAVMRFARNKRDLLEWATFHKSIINDELTEKEREVLRGVYMEMMDGFNQKDAA